jgi:hypothetical protein
MCTGGEYRGVRQDRHFSAASSFQIGVSRGRRREAHQMAMPIHDRWLQQHRDKPRGVREGLFA